MGRPATQDWVHDLTLMQQSVLLAAVRGPDGIRKQHVAKVLLRWYRRCILISAFDGKALTTPTTPGGGSFTGPSMGEGTTLPMPWTEFMHGQVGEYLRCVDELPHHFQLHFMHAAEIIGFKHPDPAIRKWWNEVYLRLVHDMHLFPETEAQMDSRLGDTFDGWAARNEEAARA